MVYINPAMTIIPAIDIREGRCVRLVKGERGTETVFSEDPVAVAREWEKCGAETIHLVDLDGAFSGAPVNASLISQIASAVSCPVQVGGGIRNIEAVRGYMSSGTHTAIIGTAALEDGDFVERACGEFPGRIAAALDTRGDMVAVKGWTENSSATATDAAETLERCGVSKIIRTDIDRDGTLSGVDTERLRGFLSGRSVPVVASGGVSSESDIEQLLPLRSSGLSGVIVGKAIYSGRIDLARAIRRFS